MGRRRVEELRDELHSLLTAQIESLKEQTFLGLSEEVLGQQKLRLNRIREISSLLLAAMKRRQSFPKHAGMEHGPEQTTGDIAAQTDEESNKDLELRIRTRAYELYTQRGKLDGHALNDWLRAEEEILRGVSGHWAWRHETERNPLS